MPAPQPAHTASAQSANGRAVWPHRLARAADVLRARAARRRQLSPQQVAATVLAVLPRAARAELRARLDPRWLSPDAELGCDLVETATFRAAVPPPAREFVRLLLFGPPGQGVPYEAKHRQGLYQHFCAEIMREERDVASLRASESRALSHADVQRDPILAGMLRSFVAERIAALAQPRTSSFEDLREYERSFLLRDRPRVPTREQLVHDIAKLERLFEDQCAHFDEPGAARSLQQMRDLQQRYPVHLDAAPIERRAADLQRLRQRCTEFRDAIEHVIARGIDASRAGNQDLAAWCIRRLQAIHALRPALLPADRADELRQRILRVVQQQENREAVERLLHRERAIAAEIQQLAGTIHRFHAVARRAPHDSPEFQEAELAYRAAVRAVRSHDTEWLAALILELEALVEDLRENADRAQHQLDRFIQSVRGALLTLRSEILTIQKEQTAAIAPPGAAIPPAIAANARRPASAPPPPAP